MTTAILSIGVMDSGQGAGLDRDILTAASLGARALPVVAVIGGGRALGRAHELPLTVVRDQIADCLAEGQVGAIKIGRLLTPAMVNAVSDAIEDLAPGLPLVLDVVMVGGDGAHIVEEGALRHVKIRLLPLTTVLIANLPEAELLAGMALRDPVQREHGAAMMLTLGAKSVVVKGGSGDEPTPYDLFVTEEEARKFTATASSGVNASSSGASFSAAVACGLAAGMSITQAVTRAHDYVEALMTGRSRSTDMVAG